MKQVDLYCRCCKKSIKTSYILTGNEETPFLPNVIVKCNTHKCCRAITFKNYTEGFILTHTDKEAKFYV